MAQKTITICDVCSKEIDTNSSYLDAGVYGVHFHLECFANLTPEGVIKALNLDDIVVCSDLMEYSEKAVTKTAQGMIESRRIYNA